MEEYIQDILSNLLTALGEEFGHIQIDHTTNIDNEEEYYCNVETKNASLLIGKNGQNMQAIQVLVKLILLKRTGKNININLDVDSYKVRQEESTIGLAERHIAKAIETGKPQSLPPMTPYYRRLVHMHISEKYPNLATSSKGFGNYRHIVVNKK